MLIHEIHINDLKYRYTYYEQNPNAPYGIFLMGTLQEIESVTYFSENFAEYLNLFVVEIPGLGHTDPLPSTYSIQDQAAMLLDFVKLLKIPSAHVMAISYSTPIAAEFCGLWPGARSLSLCGGTAGVDATLRRGSMVILAEAYNDRKAFAKRFIEGMTVNDPKIKNGKVIARRSRMHIYSHTDKQMECFCENTLRLLAYKPSKNLSRFKQPSLLFIGDQDPYVSRRKALELASALPNCEFQLIPHADHLVHIEYPELTTSLMLKLTQEDIGAGMLISAPLSVA